MERMWRRCSQMGAYENETYLIQVRNTEFGLRYDNELIFG